MRDSITGRQQAMKESYFIEQVKKWRKANGATWSIFETVALFGIDWCDDEDFIGKHVVEILSQLNKKGIKLPRNNDLSKNTADYNKALEYFQKGFELGDEVSGYNAALIYIKEAKPNEAIPYLTYGVSANHIPSIKLLAK